MHMGATQFVSSNLVMYQMVNSPLATCRVEFTRRMESAAYGYDIYNLHRIMHLQRHDCRAV